MEPQDKALLERAKTELLDLLQAFVDMKMGETELSTIAFGQLGVVTWWLERGQGAMPPKIRQQVAEGSSGVRRLLAQLRPPVPMAKA